MPNFADRTRACAHTKAPLLGVLLAVLLATALGLNGCGGSVQRPQASSAPPRPSSPFAEVQVLAPGPYSGARFARFAVNPTVETREARVATFGIVTDRAAFDLVRAILEGGALPPPNAARIEAFVNAMGADEPAPSTGLFAIYADLLPSPQRAGYHVLRIALKAREGWEDRKNRSDRVILIASAKGPGARLRAQIAQWAKVEVAVGQQLSAGLAGRLDAPGRAKIVFISDGRGITPADLRSARGLAHTHQLVVVGVNAKRVDEAALQRLARAGAASYHFLAGPEHAAALARRLAEIGEPVARDVRLQVVFDPKTVSRYRLLGHEGARIDADRFREPGNWGSPMAAGATATALFEIKRTGAAGPLGTLRTQYLDREARRSVEAPLRPTASASFEAASPSARLAVIAAGFAEKLRQAYWARGLDYETLERLLRDLPPAFRQRAPVRALADLIVRARHLDRRPDRYRGLVPVAQMGFDHVPVSR